MTTEQLDNIRARHAEGFAPRMSDATLLLAEVERLTAEVEVLRGVGCMEDGDGPCGVCRKCAFQRGVAAMREAAAHLVEHKPRHGTPTQGTGFAQFGCGYCDMAAQVRALPNPEDTP